MTKRRNNSICMRLVVVVLAVFVALCAGCDLSGEGGQKSDAEDRGDPSLLNELYRQKAQELVDQFGSPSIQFIEDRSFIAGVAYTSLVDFGLGPDLVICYRDPSVEVASPYADRFGYKLQVWAPADGGSALQCLYDADPGHSIVLTCVDGQYYLLLLGSDSDDAVVTHTLVGVTEDGAMGELEHAQSAGVIREGFEGSGSDEERYAEQKYELNGEETSADVWREKVGLWLQDEEVSNFTGYGTSPGNLSKLVNQTQDELELLGVIFDRFDTSQAVEAANADLFPLVDIPDGIPTDGYFQGSLPLSSPSAFKSSLPEISEISFDGSAFSFMGSMRYSLTRAGLAADGCAATIGPQQWSIPAADSIVYLSYGRADGPKLMSESSFLSFASTQSGMGVCLQVSDGAVVSASILS